MGSKRRSSDIISLLVSIYGSKDIFIDEYRAVLADRLLHQLNYNTARSGLAAASAGGSSGPGADGCLWCLQGDP